MEVCGMAMDSLSAKPRPASNPGGVWYSPPLNRFWLWALRLVYVLYIYIVAQVGDKLPDLHDWEECDIALCEFDVRDSGRIEDRPEVFIQTDFAIEYIVGWVLNTGRVQVCLYLLQIASLL